LPWTCSPSWLELCAITGTLVIDEDPLCGQRFVVLKVPFGGPGGEMRCLYRSHLIMLSVSGVNLNRRPLPAPADAGPETDCLAPSTTSHPHYRQSAIAVDPLGAGTAQ
jgi:hypothetical protein